MDQKHNTHKLAKYTYSDRNRSAQSETQ